MSLWRLKTGRCNTSETVKDLNIQAWSPQCAAGFAFSLLVLLIGTEPEFVSSAVLIQFAEKSPVFREQDLGLP